MIIITAALAQALDVSPHALDVPDIDSYIGLMHTLFTPEDIYVLTVSEADREMCLKVNVRKGKETAHLHEMLCAYFATELSFIFRSLSATWMAFAWVASLLSWAWIAFNIIATAFILLRGVTEKIFR